MSGRGPVPKEAGQRRTRHVPTRGDWQAKPGIGWQHGQIPDPPDGLHAKSAEAWQTWMKSWWASHWVPEDMPALGIVIQLFDQCGSFFDDPYVEKESRKGDTIYVLKPNPTTELRQMMDNYGITPKGQQDRRWSPPKPEEGESAKTADLAPSRFAHLRTVVNE